MLIIGSTNNTIEKKVKIVILETSIVDQCIDKRITWKTAFFYSKFLKLHFSDSKVGKNSIRSSNWLLPSGCVSSLIQFGLKINHEKPNKLEKKPLMVSGGRDQRVCVCVEP